MPSSVSPARKSTRTTRPSLSVAEAVNVAGTPAVALPGALSDTVGGIGKAVPMSVKFAV
ncbi:MAG: hypothetical protein U1F49_08275 [Rubrivivax sp.]